MTQIFEEDNNLYQEKIFQEKRTKSVAIHYQDSWTYSNYSLTIEPNMNHFKWKTLTAKVEHFTCPIQIFHCYIKNIIQVVLASLQNVLANVN